MSGTTSWVELTWTGVAVICFLLSLRFVHLGWTDMSDVRARIHGIPPRAVAWGPRWWSALSTILIHLAFALLFWLPFVMIGLVAMRYPPPPPSPDQTVSAQYLGYLFLVAELGITFIQSWMLYVRYKIEQAIPVPDAWRGYAEQTSEKEGA